MSGRRLSKPAYECAPVARLTKVPGIHSATLSCVRRRCCIKFCEIPTQIEMSISSDLVSVLERLNPILAPFSRPAQANWVK